MKKALFTCAFILVLGFVKTINAQCDLGYSDFKILGEARDAQTVTTPNGTLTSFVVDISFKVKYNDNAKRLYIHTFLTQDFNDFFDCNNPNNPAPTSAVLGTSMSEPGKSIYDLAIDNSSLHGAAGVDVPVTLLQTYAPDPNVALTSSLNSPGITVTKNYTGANNTDVFVVKNMLVYINNYNSSSLSTQTLVWANDGTTSQPQCTLCPAPVSVNAPTISGDNNCNNFSFTITSTNPEQRNVTCAVYVDFNANGVIDGSDFLIKTLSATFSGTVPYSSGSQKYDVASAINSPLLIRVSSADFGPYYGTTTYDASVACGILPVNFRSFTAVRNSQSKEKVLLKWETEKEQNNSGFYVQRRINSEWQSVTFIKSKASNGNSNSILTYEYTDMNTTKGVTQYRLKQVDLDEKTVFSEVKAVLGKETGRNILVYPNPSFDGSVNIVFNELHSVKEVVVSDMSGRVVKYYPQVTNNNLTIDGLISGFYTIKVTDRSTSVSSVEKVVVK